MINIRLLLGLFPKTESYEAKSAALWKEYEDFSAYSESDELKHFLELEKTVTGADFKSRTEAIKAQKFSNTEEFKTEQEYLGLKKSPQFKTYLKVKGSNELANFIAFESSSELARIAELEKAEDEESKKELQKLLKSSAVKKFNKFKESAKYKTFYEVDHSDLPDKYIHLEEKVHSEEFKKVKEYMALSPAKKFMQSEEYKLQEEYLGLKKSEKIKWYFEAQKADKFKELKKLKLEFSDDFTNSKLDTEKWLTRHYFGDKILGAPYSLSTEQQFFTDGKNLEVAGSELKIHTKKEDVRGHAWDPALGFFLKDYSYTSGLINTGKSFRQQYGVFEAKVKLNNPGKVTHAWWLTGDSIVPQIDIFKTDNNKILLTSFWGNIAEKDGVKKKTIAVSASKLMGDYFVFSLEWTATSLTWKVNGLKLASLTESVPSVPLYLNFSSGIYKDSVNGSVPANMTIDWVKVYSKAE